MNSDSGDVVSYVKGRCATTVVAVPQLGRLIGFLLRSRPRNQAPDFPAVAAGAPPSAFAGFCELPASTLATTPTLHLLPLDRSHPARLRHSWRRTHVPAEGKMTRRDQSQSPMKGLTG